MRVFRKPRIVTLAAATTLLPLAPAAAQQQALPSPPTAPVVSFEIPANVINMILVKVNGDPILLSDLRELLDERMPLLEQQFPEEEIVALLPQLQTDLLAGLIDEKMVLQRADRLGITVDANQVDRQFQAFREGNGFTTDAELEAALAPMGLSIEDVREQLRNNIRQQQLMFDEVQRQIFVAESEIRTYYERNASEFTAPAQVRLEQLLFIGDAASMRDQAVAAAAELRAGADPEATGSKYVNAQFVADTGTYIAVADLTSGLDTAVPTLPVGEFSDPIQTQFGYSLVKVVERTETAVTVLADVREEIRNRLTNQKSQERMNEYLASLRVDTHLEVLDARFEALKMAWQSPPDEETEQ